MDYRYQNGNTMRIYGDSCGILPDEEAYYADFLYALTDAIDMQQLTDPVVATYVNFEDEFDNGISATTMITTSHLSIHSWLNLGGVRIVVDSCKDFDSETIIEMVRNWFRPKFISYDII